MCGIFGIINSKDLDLSKIEKVSKTIKHRGPDDEGYILFDIKEKKIKELSGDDSLKDLQLPHIKSSSSNYNSTFLHRRLSILDLSKSGHQPMSYDNGNYWITYNGEIYNYLEIKIILKEKGYKFQSQSDTEVVLASYMEWGESCIHRFNGMWAFAIWDLKNEEVFISRDRFGIKPLHFYYDSNCLIFSSEIKGIKQYLSSDLQFNEDTLIRFLYNGQLNIGFNNETMFKDIYQLRAGHNLTFRNNEIYVNRYWHLNFQQNNFSFEENVFEFKNLFEDSIKLHLRSDVDVGSCLSGGIDSSSIVSLVSKKFNKRLHTFSAIWPGDINDESTFINEVVNLYNCYDHSFEPDVSNYDEIVNKISWHQEVPVGGSSLYAQWSVMEMAKKNNIKVLLDGQGADEVIAGYPRFVRTYLNELLSKFNFSEILNNYSSLKEKRFNVRRILNLRIPQMFYINKNAKLFIKNIKQTINENHKQKVEYYYNLTQHLIDELESTCLPHLLHYEDRNSMAHSIESRVPFLDYRLVEFSLGIPTEQRIKGSLTKVILRESMKEYLPIRIYERKDKIGFSTPIEKRLADNKLINKIKQNVKNNEILTKFINPDAVDNDNYLKIDSLDKFINVWK